MAALWPGPLTLVLRRQPSLVAARRRRVSVRMPLHPVTLSVVRAGTDRGDVGQPPRSATSDDV